MIRQVNGYRCLLGMLVILVPAMMLALPAKGMAHVWEDDLLRTFIKQANMPAEVPETGDDLSVVQLDIEAPQDIHRPEVAHFEVQGSDPLDYHYAGYDGDAGAHRYLVGVPCDADSTETTYYCPAGWTLSGDTCTGTVTETDSADQWFSCPSGWDLHDDVRHEEHCARTVVDTQDADASYSCPAGWDRSGTTCSKDSMETQDADVSYSCPTGWSRSGSTCSRSTTETQDANVSYSCESGHLLVGSTCQDNYAGTSYDANASYSCSEGWDLDGSTCSRTTTDTQSASTNYSCPTGWNRNGSTCSRVVTDTQSASVNYSCPTDWTLDGTTCSKATEETKPATEHLVCPSGWEQDGSVCSRSAESTQPASVRDACPSGEITINALIGARPDSAPYNGLERDDLVRDTAVLGANDIVLLVDVSGSMRREVSGGRTRMEIAEEVVNTIGPELEAEGNNVAVVEYDRHARVRLGLDEGFRYLPFSEGGGTWTHLAISRARQMLSGRPSPTKLIIDITDGVANRPGETRDQVEAVEAKSAEGWAIAAIGIGLQVPDYYSMSEWIADSDAEIGLSSALRDLIRTTEELVRDIETPCSNADCSAHPTDTMGPQIEIQTHSADGRMYHLEDMVILLEDDYSGIDPDSIELAIDVGGLALDIPVVPVGEDPFWEVDGQRGPLTASYTIEDGSTNQAYQDLLFRAFDKELPVSITVHAADMDGNTATEQAEFPFGPERYSAETIFIPSVDHTFTRDGGRPALEVERHRVVTEDLPSAGVDYFIGIAHDSPLGAKIDGEVVEPGQSTYWRRLGPNSPPLSAVIEPVDPGQEGRAKIIAMPAHPVSRAVEIDAEIYVPSIELEPQQERIVQAIDQARVHAHSTSHCELARDAQQAAGSDIFTQPRCVVEWKLMPSEVYGVPGALPPAIDGLVSEAGEHVLSYRLLMIDSDRSRIEVNSGEIELEVVAIEDALSWHLDPDLDEIRRIVDEIRFDIQQSEGPNCPLHREKETAMAEASRGHPACYGRWVDVPDGPEELRYVGTPHLFGAIQDEEGDEAAFVWEVSAFMPSGEQIVVGEYERTYPLVDPPRPEITVDDRNHVVDDLFAATISGGIVGDARIEAYPADLEIDILSEDEMIDQGFYDAGFGNRMSVRRRVEALSNEMWAMQPYTLHAYYHLLPWIGTEKNIRILTVPDYGVRPEVELAETTVLDIDTFDVRVRMQNPYQGGEYLPETMGQWEIRLINHMSFSRQEPLTEFKKADPETGEAEFSVTFEDMEINGLRLSAEARLISPVPEYERTKIAARPIFMTVLRGGAIEGDLESRRLEGEAPLNVMVSMGLESQLDWGALGDVTWELREEGGEWAPYEGELRIENRFNKIFDAGVYELRAHLVNKHSEAESYLGPLTIHAYDVPQVEMEGPWNVFMGGEGHYQLSVFVDGEPVPEGRLEVQWSEDRGETWSDGGMEYTVSREERERVFISARARLNDAPRQSEDAWQVVHERVTFQPIRPPRVGIYGPRLIEVGDPEEWRAAVREPYRHMDVEIRGEFITPDGEVVPDLDVLEYAATEQDRENERIELRYRAWIEGFREQGAEAEANRRIRVWEYEWPEWTFYVRKSAHYAPAEVFIRMRTPGGTTRYLEELSYEWEVPAAATIIENRHRDGIGLSFDEPGLYPISVRIRDGRSHDSTVTYKVDLSEPPPWAVNFDVSASNDFMRAPLDVRFRPDVGGGHPRDRIREHRYLVDGEVAVEGQRYGVLTLDEPGVYSIGLEVETDFGEVHRFEDEIEVVENQPPVCSLDSRESSSGWRFYARCEDPDGRVLSHRWFIDGEEVGIRGSRISVSKRETDRPAIKLIGIDDSGAESEPVRW